MSLIKATSFRIRTPGRGFLPTPCLIVLIYCALCYLVHLQFISSFSYPSGYWFWPEPHYFGLTLLDLFTWTNILLAAYLIVSLLAFALEKNNRTFRAIAQWTTYPVAFVILVLLQVYINKTDEKFGLPDEIVKLRATEFRTLIGTEPEDLILPLSDMCVGIRNPDAKRSFVSITRKGHYIWNLNHDHENDTLDMIQSKLASKAEQLGLNPNGSSPMILLIRADREAEFANVHKVMQVCAGESVRLDRVELHCYCDMNRKMPEGVKRMPGPFWVEGKLDVYLPSGKDLTRDTLQGHIDIDVFWNRRAEAGFDVVARDQRFEGPGMLDDLHKMMKDLRFEASSLEVRINAHENVQYRHVIDVFSECLRAGMVHIRFNCIQG